MKVRTLVISSFLFLFLYEIAAFNTFGFSTDNLFVFLYISIVSSFLLFFKKQYLTGIDRVTKKLIIALLFIFLIAYIRGLFTAENYLDYKLIFAGIYGGSAMLSVSFIMIGLSVTGFFVIMRLLLKHLVWISLIFLVANIFIEQIFSRMMISVFVLMLMFSYLSQKQKRITFLIGMGSLLTGLNWRANTLRLIFSFGTIFLNNKLFRFKRLKRGVLISLFILPVFGLYYSITHESVFELNAFSNTGLSEDYKVDTRTFLYSEVFQDLIETKSLLFGKGLLGTYKSLFFDFENGRHQVEVGFLKYLIQVGLIGFLIISFLLLRVSYLGFKRSNNKLSKQFAIFLAFHFFFLFIEGIPAISQYYYFVWAIIGLLMSERFRSLTDDEISNMLYPNKSM